MEFKYMMTYDVLPASYIYACQEFGASVVIKKIFSMYKMTMTYACKNLCMTLLRASAKSIRLELINQNRNNHFSFQK